MFALGSHHIYDWQRSSGDSLFDIAGKVLPGNRQQAIDCGAKYMRGAASTRFNPEENLKCREYRPRGPDMPNAPYRRSAHSDVRHRRLDLRRHPPEKNPERRGVRARS